jgi:hypothetical protein
MRALMVIGSVSPWKPTTLFWCFAIVLCNMWPCSDCRPSVPLQFLLENYWCIFLLKQTTQFVITMSSKVKVDIRITIFYSDGVVVVVYIWLFDVHLCNIVYFHCWGKYKFWSDLNRKMWSRVYLRVNNFIQERTLGWRGAAALGDKMDAEKE